MNLSETESRALRFERALDGLAQIAAAGGETGRQTDVSCDALASLFDLLAAEAKAIAAEIAAALLGERRCG